MSRYWSSRASLEIRPITIKRSTWDNGSPAKAKEFQITRSCCSLTLSNKLENLASNRPFWEKEERLSPRVCCTRVWHARAICVCEDIARWVPAVLRLRCRYPAIFGGISCRPDSRVKGLPDNWLKGLSLLTLRRPKLMSHALLNHSWNHRETVWCRMP